MYYHTHIHGWDGCGFKFRQGLFSKRSRPYGPPILSSMNLGSFRGVQRPGHETDHSSPSSVEVRNEWSYTSTPPVCLKGFDRDLYIHIHTCTGVGKSRLTVVSTRDTVYSCIIIYLLLYYLFVLFVFLFVFLFVLLLLLLFIVIIITCMSFSIRTTVNLLLPTPLNIYKDRGRKSHPKEAR
jgi:hypothetical protein